MAVLVVITRVHIYAKRGQSEWDHLKGSISCCSRNPSGAPAWQNEASSEMRWDKSSASSRRARVLLSPEGTCCQQNLEVEYWQPK